MLHDSKKKKKGKKQTNNKTTIHDLFLYFKNLHMFKKNQIYILRKIEISFDVRKI